MKTITIKQYGDFKKTNNFLKNASIALRLHKIEKYAQEGVAALSAATPVDTGLTAQSWSYDIERTDDRVVITWYNTNVVNHVNIALILQYGHATKNGKWIEGTDYINPAIQPIFNKIAETAWKEVTKK